MQNKDNLEEFIKSEVNKIELGGEDAMWQNFQGRLEKMESNSKKGYKSWLSLLSLLILIAAGGLYIILSINQENTQEALIDELSAVSNDTNAASSSATILDHKSTGTPQKEISKPDELPPAKIGKQSRLSENKNFNRKNSTVTNEKLNSSGTTKINLNTNNFGNIDNRNSTIANAQISNQNIDLQISAKAIGSEFELEKLEKEKATKKKSEELLAQQNNEANIKLLSVLGIKPLKSLTTTKHRNPNSFSQEWHSSITKAYFVSIENSFAKTNISQHGIGVGIHLLFKNNIGIKIQAGGTLDQGYSFSQDSLKVLNGLSIEEIRTDKDLKNLWNTYLDLGLLYNKNNWNFGAGLRGGYAILNQFYFKEVRQVTHMGTFKISGGTGSEEIRIGNWSGINRMSLDVYLNTHYQFNHNYSVGLVISKRLNELINSGMAQQAYPNTPVKIGLLLNKYF